MAPTAGLRPGSGTTLVKEMLASAYEYVREGWCQGSHAQDACGRPVSPASVFARKWSAPGALARAWASSENQFDAGLEAFEQANLALATAAGDVPQAWNDADGRTVGEVLEVMTVAVEHVGGPSRDPFNLPKVRSASH
jgi:hypothetical protein